MKIILFKILVFLLGIVFIIPQAGTVTAAVQLGVITQEATGNLNAWTLHSESPVMSFGSFGGVWYDGITYHCYYTHDINQTIGHATSADGITWIDDTTHNPLLTIGNSGSWDDTYIAGMNVWQESGVWYGLYRGNGTKIGLATSSDGLTWIKYASNPVIDLPDCNDPAGIIKVGSTYYLYTNSSGGYGSNRRVNILTSTDLHSWTLQTPSPVFSGERYCSAPFKYNGIYYLLVSRYYDSGLGGILELWHDSNPTFKDGERVFDGVVAFDATHKVDTPTIITNTIYRDSFPNSELYVYYSKATLSDGWHLYLTIQSNISTAVKGSKDTVVTIDKDGNTRGAFNGTLVNMDGALDTVWFEYGLDTNYGSETDHQVAMSAGYFFAPVPTNLIPGRIYHYRAVANGILGTSYGSDQAFTVPVISQGLAVFRPGGTWIVDTNRNGAFDPGVDWSNSPNTFGRTAGDVPLAIDWNGDGVQELAIFRQGGTWFIDTNHNGAFDPGVDWSNSPNTFGRNVGDVPLAIDWNGDGVQELAIFRQGGTWFIDLNHNGAFEAGVDWSNSPNTFGRTAGDVPLAIDWNGDGVQELAIFRQGGTWFIDLNHNGAFEAGVDWSNSPNTFGRTAGDVPLAIEWNGDGVQELAIFRQGGTWFIDMNHNGAFEAAGSDLTNSPNTFGQLGDIPLTMS